MTRRTAALLAAFLLVNAVVGETSAYAQSRDDDADAEHAEFRRPKTDDEKQADRFAQTFGHLELSVGAFSGVIVKAPITQGVAVSQYRSSTDVPALAGATFRSGGSDALLGFELGLAVHTDSFMTYPLFGVRGAFLLGGDSVGATYTMQTLPSATTASVSLGPSAFGELLLPGLGVELRSASVVFRATMEPAVQIYALSGTLSQGYVTQPITSSHTSFGLDASLELCSRRSVFSNLCVSASPLLWRTDGDQGALSGVLFGFGWRAIGTTH